MPLAGADALWRKRATRWIVVGELHGTTETPAAFGDLVCRASRARGQVTVALEHPDIAQAEMDAYLASNGSDEDRAILLRAEPWRSPFKDGRTSQAYFDLIERLRRMKQSGAVTRVVAFQPTIPGEPAKREAAMARALIDASPTTETLVIALVGNVHAGKSQVTFGESSYLPAAALMPAASTISLDAYGNGEAAWNCRPGCGPHAGGLAQSPAKRGVVITPIFGPAYDGALHLGTITTASPPAR